MSILSMGFASAITGAIGNARMILRAEVGDSIEKYILVKNVNDIPISINLSASGDLEKYINILDNNFILQAGEDKKAYFTIKANKAGSYDSKVHVMFTPEEGNGVGLTSTIILVVYGEGEMPDESDDPSGDDTGNGITGSSIRSNSNSFNPALFLIITPILLIILLFLLMKKTSKHKQKKAGNNAKLNSKKELRHK